MTVMLKEPFGGNGATKERLQKSRIATGARLISKGGMVIGYGHHDTEHCALDYMLEKGFIEPYHYDAGYELRSLYYTFTITGRWIEEGGKAYDGDLMTHKDYAQERYRKALLSIDLENRAITRCICVEALTVPADYHLIRQVVCGLGDLIKYFENEEKNTCEEF